MYSLKELTERWNKTENDILRMAVKREFQVWTFADFYGFYYEKIKDGIRGEGNTRWALYSPDGKRRCEVKRLIGDCGTGGWIKQLVRVPCKYLPGLIMSETIKTNFLYGDTDEDIYEALEEYFAAMYHRLVDIPPSKRRTVTVEKKALCVKVEEVERMEETYPELQGKALGLHVKQLTQESVVMPREEEKPLRTIKAIAEYCEVHGDTVKEWRKKYTDFPASLPGEGSVTALPSALNAWMIKKGKK